MNRELFGRPRAGGRTGQAGRGRMSVRPCRPWWYHISGHYPCVYAEIEKSKLNIRLQSTFKSAVATKFSCKFILHHVVNRALSTSHGKKFASVAQSGRSGPGRSTTLWPDFTSKVRPGRQSRPAEASGLRPSALASRPPALKISDNPKLPQRSGIIFYSR